MIQWSDEAIVLASRRTGESCWIIDVFSDNHGKWRCLTKSKVGVLVGSLIDCHYRADNEDAMGWLHYENIGCGIDISQPMLANLIMNICQLIHLLLMEQHRNAKLYELLKAVIVNDDADWVQGCCNIEWELLRGYGIYIGDEHCYLCRQDGVDKIGCYVSPKTGRRGCANHSVGYEDKLLKILFDEYMNNLELNNLFFKKLIEQEKYNQVSYYRRNMQKILRFVCIKK